MIKASVSRVLTKSNRFLLRLFQIRVPHFGFSKYSWESLKSDLCRRGEVENRDKKWADGEKDNKFRVEGDLTDKEWSSANRKADEEGWGSVFVFIETRDTDMWRVMWLNNWAVNQFKLRSIERSSGGGNTNFVTKHSCSWCEEECVLHTKNAIQHRPGIRIEYLAAILRC